MRLLYYISDTVTFKQYKIKMPDHKQLCKTCKTRHLPPPPPTGKKCKQQKKQMTVGSDNELLSDAAVAGQVPATQNKQEVSGDG